MERHIPMFWSLLPAPAMGATPIGCSSECRQKDRQERVLHVAVSTSDAAAWARRYKHLCFVQVDKHPPCILPYRGCLNSNMIIDRDLD